MNPIGLSDTNGRLLFFFEETDAGEQSSFVVSIYHTDYEVHSAPVTTLDSYCAEKEIERIDFLKIDCEGFDYKVLLGAKELLTQENTVYPV
ncbi:hypothetical protein BH10BAC3_BH10BAC3_33890 [soil metagenome]